MKEKMKLVMATNNAGKLREARAIAGDNIEILSLADIGFHQDIPETADTLEGNALLKARAVSEASGLDCFADDTGLMVDALGGAPGVYSARYAGPECDPEANIRLLLHNLEGADKRTARFRTSIALSLGGEEHLFEGNAEGEIALSKSGSNGFGYDPVFISADTGKCFAEMTDEEKNSISHRGRALRAMMKWLGAMTVCLLSWLRADAALSADWAIYNTFDDKIEMVYDTPEKTYYLVHAQLYQPGVAGNSEKELQLFCLEKESGEVRPYNTLNFLSHNIIRNASYNAQRRYLLIVYDDFTIDLLDDDGNAHTITGLKNFSTSSTKNVRSISFDPERNRAYLATDFGFVAIDDKKHEVAESGIYNTPVDNIVRTADRLIINREGKLYWNSADSNHSSLSTFRQATWADGDSVMNLVALSPTKCIFSKNLDGTETHYILTFTPGVENPKRSGIGSFQGADIAENRDGLLLTRTSQLVQIDRTTGARTFLPRRSDDYAVKCGSWDTRDVYYATPRDGFYSLRRNDKNEYTMTSEPARPNAPAAFRSDNFLYTPKFGMLVNTHGISQSFSEHQAYNFVLLSSLKDGEWEMHGIPYLDYSQRARVLNPTGMAQDPDDPDVIYMGSTLNGMIRYNITDYSDVLHITRSNDSPEMEGHVSAIEPYPHWTTFFPLLNPRFDKNGNLVVAHVETPAEDFYDAEIWIWTPEDRKASKDAASYRPMKRLKINNLNPQKSAIALPLASSASNGMVMFLPIRSYRRNIAIYDHKNTIEDESDDRVAMMKELYDNDGSVTYDYLYCAVEDPATGLVWVGTSNGVFTFNPADAFTNPGKISRIKVSRNDGTSLADYLLSGISVNHIAIDGKGRKWFSLPSGGIVVTSADGKTILEEISSDNSMLPSDIVYATCYNPERNSMMIGTSAGICEYFLSSAGGNSSESDVKIYPNPVRPDYYGWVTIEGLEDDALVKIADAAGNIVCELGPASGGRLQWDAAGRDRNRVASGVYYILASSGKDGGNYSAVGKVLVMNR